MQTTARPPRYFVIVIAVLAGLALLVVGCVGAVYKHADEAARELDLSSIGEIRVEAHSGAGTIGGARPSYQAIVAGEHAYQELFDRLTELGYECTSEDDDQLQSEWRRTLGGVFVSVSVVEVLAGGDILIGSERKPIEADGIKVTVASS